MTQQVLERKPLICKWCRKVEITFSRGKVSKTGKSIPLNALSLVPHNCSENPYNQQRKEQPKKDQMSTAAAVDIATVKTTTPTLSELEKVELVKKLDTIITYLKGLCERYEVVIDNVQSGD